MNNTKDHQRLVDDILFAVGSLTNVRCWTRNVGVGRAMGNNNHIVRYGTPGEADLQGIIAPTGRMLAIEIKTGTGKLSDKQKKWRDMIESFGGLYVEARSVQQALDAVLSAIENK